MAAAKKTAAQFKPAPTAALPVPPQVVSLPLVDQGLHERATADPLFREARRQQQRGEAPPLTYMQA